ncbi:MAG: hypothetical protein H7A55_19675 [Verrucomicrobiaceae bacterium]|nr:hypothetical protein [Verrucomicrobiaceae bacterium]
MKCTAAFLVFFVTSIPAFSLAQDDGPQIIVDRAAPDIFPESWRTPKINAQAEELSAERQPQCRDLIERALAKYPTGVLRANLKKVYGLGSLQYSAVPTGGTNSRTAVYLVSKDRYSLTAIEEIFHAEFSSILLRNFPHHLDSVAWQQLNPPGFHYRGSGVQAIKTQQASQRLRAALHEEGFLNEYGKASPEEDFNSFAGRLFLGDPALWNAIEHYPKVKAKAELAIAFYHKLDATFTHPFFLSLRQPDPAGQSAKTPPQKGPDSKNN